MKVTDEMVLAYSNATLGMSTGSAHTIRRGLEEALGSQAAAPDGWVLVPREPTEFMIGEGILAYNGKCETSYRAMVSAAPPAPLPAHEAVPVAWTDKYELESLNGKQATALVFTKAVAEKICQGTMFPLYTSPADSQERVKETGRPERVQAAFHVWHEKADVGPNASALFDYILKLERALATTA